MDCVYPGKFAGAWREKEEDKMDKMIFKIEGPALEESVPLHTVVEALSALESIIDKSYLMAIGKERLTLKDRRTYEIRSHAIAYGSFMMEFISDFLDIFPGIKGHLVAMIPVLAIVHRHKEDQRNVGQSPTNAEKRANRDNKPKGNPGPIEERTARFVLNALPNLKSLTSMIEKNSVRRIHLLREVGGKTKKIFSLSQKERKIVQGLRRKDFESFVPQEAYDDHIEQFVGIIFSFNKRRNRGRLEVCNVSDGIARGLYNFEVMKETPQRIKKTIEFMIEDRVKITCQRGMRYDARGKARITKLGILDIAPRP